MKTLKLFLASMFLVFLATGISSAQGNKTVFTETQSQSGVIVCAGDYVSGEVTYTTTYWDGKVQLRYKATYYGLSGKTYTWSLVQNTNMKEWMEGTALNQTDVLTSVVECEGVPIAIYKTRYHITLNANGEVTVEFIEGTEGWECL